MTDRAPQFIVAEISKNWHAGVALTPGFLCEDFERVIEINRRRGYRLHSFTLHRLMASDIDINETIIAVFELAMQAGARPAEAGPGAQVAADAAKGTR